MQKITEPRTEIADALLDHLRIRTARSDLAYAEPPERMSGGFDATILAFRLRDAPAPFSAPLVLRLLEASVDPLRVPREAAVQNALAELGFPAPRAVLVEPGAVLLGGPFLIMERVRGRPPGSELEGLKIRGLRQSVETLRQLPRLWRELGRLWDEAQTRLHRVPVDAFLGHLETDGIAADSLAFETHLAALRGTIDALALDGLRPVSDWLATHRPPQPQTLVVCHGDFQPLNILADEGRLTGVIDWVKAAIAEPAFDYGAAVAIMATVPIQAPTPVRQALRALMNGLVRRHAESCRAQPGGAEALRYYQVFNCLAQLVSVGKIRARGDYAHGVYNSPMGVENLVRHIRRLTGIEAAMTSVGVA